MLIVYQDCYALSLMHEHLTASKGNRADAGAGDSRQRDSADIPAHAQLTQLPHDRLDRQTLPTMQPSDLSPVLHG